MEWLGRAKTTFHHAPSPRSLKSNDGQETDILKIVEQATPPCELNPFLFNGHMQTFWAAMASEGPELYYRRTLFDGDREPYEGTFAVAFAVPAYQAEEDPELPPRTTYYTPEELAALKSDDETPMAVVLHGLSGGSHEVYLRHTLAPFVENGWAACVVNFRGCAKSKITSQVLYNARSTWDVRQTVCWLRETFPNRPLFGIGFSLGANVLTNYCGEEGPNCQLKAAVVCSNLFNLEVANKILQSQFIGRHVYLRAMGQIMGNLAALHHEDLSKHTKLDLETIAKVKYLQDFDRLIQCPTWGYPTEYAYYRDASSVDSVLAIRIPFLAINALDDPVAPKQGLPFEEFRQNPNTVMLTTSLGGHLCWFESNGNRWLPKPVFGFLDHLARNADLSSLTPSPDPPRSAEGSEYQPMRRRWRVM